MFLVPHGLRNDAGITPWCPISLADPTGWLKPINRGGCSLSSGPELLPSLSSVEGRCVSTQECTQCCLNSAWSRAHQC